jgi:hypothetical protein
MLLWAGILGFLSAAMFDLADDQLIGDPPNTTAHLAGRVLAAGVVACLAVGVLNRPIRRARDDVRRERELAAAYERSRGDGERDP